MVFAGKKGLAQIPGIGECEEVETDGKLRRCCSEQSCEGVTGVIWKR